MAITILQEPTTPNVSNTNLIYTVSSSNVPQFQYRYIADLYESGSATRLARFKYPQNSSGTANIDLGRPIDDYLDTKYNWAISNIDSRSTTYKSFEVKFGEEYGTSYTSPVTEFANEVTASIVVLKGNIQYPTLSEYEASTNTKTFNTSSINWFSEFYAGLKALPAKYEYSTDPVLSNNPNLINSPISSRYNNNNVDIDMAGSNVLYWTKTGYVSGSNWYVAQPIGTNDLGTVDYIGNDAGLNSTSVSLQAYDDNNNLILNLRGGVRTTTIDENYTLPVGITQQSYLPNYSPPIAQYSSSNQISSSAQWNWYVLKPQSNGAPALVSHFYYNEDKGPDTLMSLTSASSNVFGTWNTGSALDSGCIPIAPYMWTNKVFPTNCNNEKTRFAFVNSFGVWDYYNVYMPTRRVTKIDRKVYSQEQINLNDRIATYNVSNRGDKQYYTEYTDEFEITTDTLDSQESQWLREMFESDDVYIQSGSDFIPIIINNRQEQISNNKYRNKNFTYTIRYQFSNLREPR